MSENKFTAGPWRTGREDMQSYDGKTGQPFASVYCTDDRAGFHLGEKLPYLICKTEGDECKSNARLIAAAPELLEALEMALNTVECDSLDSAGKELPWHRAACDAIKKAKGF